MPTQQQRYRRAKSLSARRQVAIDLARSPDHLAQDESRATARFAIPAADRALAVDAIVSWVEHQRVRGYRTDFPEEQPEPDADNDDDGESPNTWDDPTPYYVEADEPVNRFDLAAEKNLCGCVRCSWTGSLVSGMTHRCGSDYDFQEASS